MNKNGIHRLSDMIGSSDVGASEDGRNYYRAVPLPFYGDRLRAAWFVLTGKAYAVHWPELGEIEKALRQ